MFGKKRMLLTINHDNAMWRRFFDYLDKRTEEQKKKLKYPPLSHKGEWCALSC